MSLSIGAVELGAVPRIAVPLSDKNLAGGVEAAGQLGDLVELRVDSFADVSENALRGAIAEVRDRSGGALPIIATVRAAEEGGDRELGDETRARLYDVAAPLVEAVDVELNASIRDAVLAAARASGRVAIVSFHDLHAMPSPAALEEIFHRGRDCGADVVKIAATARETADVLRLLEFTLRRRNHDIVTMAMGEAGAISRVFFPLAGSRLTFGFHGIPSAPGQLPLTELHAELRRYYPAFDRDARRRGR